MLQFETKVVRSAKILMVEWEDSVGSSGWQNFDSNTKDSMNIVSVGFATEVNESFIVLVPHIHKGADGMPVGMQGNLQIPRRAVTSVRVLDLKETNNVPENPTDSSVSR